MWQDWVFAIGSVGFIVSLIPVFLTKSYPTSVTSIATSAILATFAWTQHSLNLDYAAATSAVLSFTWLMIAARRQVQDRRGLFFLMHIGRCNYCAKGLLQMGWCDRCGKPDTNI